MSPKEESAKARMTSLIRDLPDDSSYDEILRELAFERMVVRGLADADGGRTCGTGDLRRRIKAWQPR